MPFRPFLLIWVTLSFFLFGLMPALAVPPSEREGTMALRGQFENRIPLVGEGTVSANATVFFSGHVGSYTAPDEVSREVMTDGEVVLKQSAMGQAIANSVAYPDFENDVLERSRKKLYFSAADDTPGYEKNQAAFRYRDLLYDLDSASPDEVVRAQFEEMGSFFGNAERERCLYAERLIRGALKYAPRNRQLRHALLDVFYDRAAAELIFAKEALVNAAQTRMDPPPVGGYIIDGEIASYNSLLPLYEGALRAYYDLLFDPLGVCVDDFDSTRDDHPLFGYYLFQVESPVRSLYEATFEVGGVPRPVIDSDGDGSADDREPMMLFSGFKDMVLLYDIERDLCQATAELARLYAMRGSQEDIDEAKEIIARTLKSSYLQGSVLSGTFPDYQPSASDASGLYGSRQGWRHGLSTLSATHNFIEGNANILGFSEDFLMLVQKFQGVKEAFDSYDALIEWIQQDDTAPLNYALTKLSEARNTYDTYRGHQDQLGTQFSDLNDTVNDRLFEICGAMPGEPAYNVPALNEGSEIQLQHLSIEVARNTIEMNTQEMANLQQEIAIEVDRRAAEANISDAMAQIYIDYGDQQSALAEEIAQINAEQVRAQNLCDAANCISVSIGKDPSVDISGGLIAYTANAFVQYEWEQEKGEKEIEVARLSAQEQADIVAQEDALNQANFLADIKTRLLGMSTLVIESREASLLLRQEIARLTALHNEKEKLENDLVESSEELVGRYFADPVHSLRYQSDVLESHHAFADAQKWVYFCARALEFKWNTPFSHFHGEQSWSTPSVYKLRNSEELEAMVAAMRDYDGMQSSLVKDDYFDWFSVREDFLGYREKDEEGNPLTYVDPDTGDSVGAIEAFRCHLKKIIDSDGNIKLRFSTARELPGGTFFRGPRYASDGTLISKGLFIDKIKWIKISLPGSHSLGFSQIAGQLSYGGTAFIRNIDVGMMTNPERPDLIEGEMTPYSTRYWYYHSPSKSWRFSESLSAPVQMELTMDADTPPSVREVDAFKERSVAATDWRLIVPTRDLGTTILHIDEIDDIRLYFYHYAVVRP